MQQKKTPTHLPKTPRPKPPGTSKATENDGCRKWQAIVDSADRSWYTQRAKYLQKLEKQLSDGMIDQVLGRKRRELIVHLLLHYKQTLLDQQHPATWDDFLAKVSLPNHLVAALS